MPPWGGVRKSVRRGKSRSGGAAVLLKAERFEKALLNVLAMNSNATGASS